MPHFEFAVVDKRGEAVRGVDTARNINEMAERLRKGGYTIIDIRAKKNFWGNLKSKIGWGQHLPLYPLIVMMRQFTTMVKASIPIGIALDTLSRQGINDRVDKAVLEVQKEVRMGQSLSGAFELQGSLFPPLMVPLIKAGEISGQLDEMLERLSLHLERELNLIRSWRQAAAYPATIFGVCCLLVLGLVTHIFPTFIGLFKGLNVDLPVATRALITITETTRNPVFILPIVVLIAVISYLAWLYFQGPIGRRQWDWLKLELPYVGSLSKRVALSRFARTLGVLLESGIPTLTSLRVAGMASGNSVIKDALDRIVQEMKGGATFSQCLGRSELFPRVFVQLVEAGEESGELPIMLMRLGDFFEDEVHLSLSVFTSLLEPVMIGVMGGIVMFVLVAVFQPVYQLMSLF